MIRIVLSFTVAILVSSSALTLRAQTKTAVSPSNAASNPDTVRTTPGQSATVLDEFVIGPGDVLAINVWKESEISKVVPVRSDGRISLPLIGELQASGLAPKQLEAEITKRLKDYVADPSVTVVVQEIHSQKINVLGMVSHPGSFPLAKPMTVVDSIATAGGFRDFAKQKDIYVLHKDANGKQIRIPVNYKDVIKGLHPEQNIELQSGDTVVVP
ncbi:MAG TPA: polysaccharide biosynthesis/export family protein [Candidatus Binatia bacterium]|nr:polysaccharide biosynthesis/export family protein [Candidatus Binatia bacterium]